MGLGTSIVPFNDIFLTVEQFFSKFGKNIVPLKVTPVPYCFNLLKSVLTKWWTRELVRREQRQRP